MSGGTTCTLTALSFINGTNSTTGGGVLNAGNLTLNQCTLSSNSVTGPAASYGGAVYNNPGGTLTLNQCTLSSNSATGNVGSSGGALYNSSGGGTLTLNQCTLSGNLAYFAGGGVFSNGGALALTHCTLSGNSATGNSNSRGGGISASSTLMLTNTIVAGNTAVTNSNVLGNITGSGGNLTSGNPMLSTLGNYGGPTLTMVPLTGSPAIDAGNDAAAASFPYDQRGAPYARIVGLHVDIGAYERGTFRNFSLWTFETFGATGFSFNGIAPNGRPYGLNYALRANPSSGSASLLPAVSSSGASHLVQFPYQARATDLIYTVQRSSDLATWSEIYRFNLSTNLVTRTGVTSSEDAINQIITINDPALGPKLFWRLVILPSP